MHRGPKGVQLAAIGTTYELNAGRGAALIPGVDLLKAVHHSAGNGRSPHSRVQRQDWRSVSPASR